MLWRIYTALTNQSAEQGYDCKGEGLEPLANVITLQMLNTPLETEAAKYINPEKDINSAEDAVAGAKDIIAEAVSDEADYRTRIRDLTMKKGHVTSTAKRSGGGICL